MVLFLFGAESRPVVPIALAQKAEILPGRFAFSVCVIGDVRCCLSL
jgi:hypothetical protein